jgi:hypothetical protein
MSTMSKTIKICVQSPKKLQKNKERGKETKEMGEEGGRKSTKNLS